MEFNTVITTRRSIRSFKPDPIPDAVLERIMEAARIAPSAVNYQPWRFVVVRDPNVRAVITQATRGQAFVGQAPVLVVCCGKRYPNPHNWIGDHLYLIDVAIAIDHLVLAARNEGVGACWIGAFEHEPIRRLLDVPADYDVVMLVPLGYPTSPALFHAGAERLPVDRVMFADRFRRLDG